MSSALHRVKLSQRTNEILDKVGRDPKTLRQCGLSDSEIKELMGADLEQQKAGVQLREEIRGEYELSNLLEKDEKGTLSKDEEKELNRRMGYFCKFDFLG